MCILTVHITARWSSQVARKAHNLEAGGSNPPRATNNTQSRNRSTQVTGIRFQSPRIHGSWGSRIDPGYDQDGPSSGLAVSRPVWATLDPLGRGSWVILGSNDYTPDPGLLLGQRRVTSLVREGPQKVGHLLRSRCLATELTELLLDLSDLQTQARTRLVVGTPAHLPLAQPPLRHLHPCSASATPYPGAPLDCGTKPYSPQPPWGLGGESPTGARPSPPPRLPRLFRPAVATRSAHREGTARTRRATSLREARGVAKQVAQDALGHGAVGEVLADQQAVQNEPPLAQRVGGDEQAG